VDLVAKVLAVRQEDERWLGFGSRDDEPAIESGGTSLGHGDGDEAAIDGDAI
jgi:hypothetical protein